MMVKQREKMRRQLIMKMEPTDEDSGEESDVACNSEAGPTATNCRTAFFTTCGENVKSEGCTEFLNHYCDGTGSTTGAGDGEGSAFCAQAKSRLYCENPSHAGAPACNWIASMPYTCKANPAAGECLANYESRSAAETACASHATDPLCDAILNHSLLVSGLGFTARFFSRLWGSCWFRVCTLFHFCSWVPN